MVRPCTLSCFLLLLACSAERDWRALDSGAIILQDLYLDQPYVAVIPQPKSPSKSRWVLTITRNSQPEGHRGEHVECLFSDDAGATWSTPARLEPGAGTVEGLTNAYSSILATDFGRLYVTYDLNIDNVTHFPSGEAFTRDDSQGAYVARWSEDGGETWSSDRVVLPVRHTRIDRENVPFNGSLLMFWCVDQFKRRPDGDATTVFLGFTKVGTYAYMPPEEAWVFTSPNLATERNVSAIVWESAPSGDTGVVSVPGNTIIEEMHIAPLSQGGGGGCFAVFRTDQGHLGAAATRDPLGATGWGPAHAASFWAATPSAASLGAVLRNPRGPVTLKRLATFPGGRYLLLFYNNGDPTFNSRNPYWLAVGVEDAALGEVVFSQPEICLFYALDNTTRPGYPDFVEDASAGALPSPACPTPDGRGCTVFITETNKTHARLHGLPPDFLTLLLRQDTLATPASLGLALTFGPSAQGQTFPTPPLPAFSPAPSAFQEGWTLEFWLGAFGAPGAAPGQTLVDVRGTNGTGFAVTVESGGSWGGSLTLQLSLRDARGVSAMLALDANCVHLLNAAIDSVGRAHVVLVVDASAHIALGVVEGFVCSGAGADIRGWQWLPLALGGFPGAKPSFAWGGTFKGALLGGRWYSRALSVSEAIGNGRAGPPAES
jgi:hypothetical protein